MPVDKKAQKKSTIKKSEKTVVKKSTIKTVKKQKVEDTSSLESLAQYLSGEAKLLSEQKRVEDLKQSAIRKQRAKINKALISGETKMDPGEDLTDEELEILGIREPVVQNLKLYSWEAPIRVHYPLDTKVFTYIVIATLAFIVYLALLGKFALMFAIIALLFLIYVASTTPPIHVTHHIMTRGVDTLDKLYEWYMLDKFWFTRKDDQYILHIKTKLRVPGEVLMLCSKQESAAIFVLLQDKLLYKELRSQGFIDLLVNGEHIPLEKI